MSPTGKGSRLDLFLVSEIPEFSRSRLQRLVREGYVSVDASALTEPSYKVQGGERIAVRVPASVPYAVPPNSLSLDILHEDDDLIVVHKPAGMVVHPAPGHDQDTLVNALVAHCGESLSGIGGVKRPGIVHRLDKDVSGVMVVAKNDRAHIKLSAQFSIHSIERTYAAIVWGLPKEPSGKIDLAIGRHPKDRKRMATVREGGKRAVTHYRTLTSIGTLAAWLEFSLETGRTHQIRVHTSHIGHPILGDGVYGPRRLPGIGDDAKHMLSEFGRIALHAQVLGFEHPSTGERCKFEASPPSSFDDLVASMRR